MKQVEEPVPIALNGPRLGGSMHGYTPWGHRTQTHAKYVRMAPPRLAGKLPMPAETNTPHSGRLREKNPAGAPTLLQGFGG
jgi:hypothetical protein